MLVQLTQSPFIHLVIVVKSSKNVFHNFAFGNWEQMQSGHFHRSAITSVKRRVEVLLPVWNGE